MKPVFFSEIEPFPCAVLKSHFPDVPNLGDMSKIEIKNEEKEITNGTTRIILDRRLDIFAGGTPCQDVSVAGKRSGMQEGSGTRSSLAFEFVRLVRELKPRYVLWENVAGVLSDKSFPEFLTALANCGYGVAYRTLDAPWFTVAIGVSQTRQKLSHYAVDYHKHPGCPLEIIDSGMVIYKLVKRNIKKAIREGNARK
jgi:DNA (cytosine-5)-methyltransferase 1